MMREVHHIRSIRNTLELGHLKTIKSRNGHHRLASRFRPGNKLAGDARSHGCLPGGDRRGVRPHPPRRARRRNPRQPRVGRAVAPDRRPELVADPLHEARSTRSSCALVRRLSTGEVANRAFLQFAFPPRYHYDVLRGSITSGTLVFSRTCASGMPYASSRASGRRMVDGSSMMRTTKRSPSP